LDYTIFRFFNTYGHKQSQDFVMSRFISRALKNEDILVYGDGSQSRTYCYIDDNIEATLHAFNGDIYLNEVVNIGNDNELSVLELANEIIDLTASKSKIVHLPPLEEGDMTRRMPDISKMKQLLNKNLLSLKEGVEKVIELGNYK
ncbi:MAG: NAD-dependent epimerase/dehydratase family protein, partial [Bacteroidetes bacterium]|nr:NAD-dependent epimerase/dehydratase family protein [Bacteroidota bacterium]